jgi:hypothetical protein
MLLVRGLIDGFFLKLKRWMEDAEKLFGRIGSRV